MSQFWAFARRTARALGPRREAQEALLQQLTDDAVLGNGGADAGGGT